MSNLRAIAMTTAALAGPAAAELAPLAHAETRPGVVATENLDGTLAATGQSFAFPGNPNGVQIERIQFDDCYEGEPPIWALGKVSTSGVVKVNRLEPPQDCAGYIDQELVSNVVMTRTSQANGRMSQWRSTRINLADTPDDKAKSGIPASFKWSAANKTLGSGKKGQIRIKTTVRNINQTDNVPGVPLGEVGQTRTVITATKTVTRK